MFIIFAKINILI